jgi:anti-sigma factor RsiW
MRAERHEDFEQRIDRSLAGAGTPEEERLVEEHVAGCAGCAEYLSAGRRAVAGLKGFSFEAGPGLNRRVMAAVWAREGARAEQMEARRRWMRLSVVALVLTVLGTVVDLQVGRWAAGFFGLPSIAVHHGLLALWIAPSFGLLLLFPMLPLLAAKGNGKGRTI